MGDAHKVTHKNHPSIFLCNRASMHSCIHPLSSPYLRPNSGGNSQSTDSQTSLSRGGSSGSSGAEAKAFSRRLRGTISLASPGSVPGPVSLWDGSRTSIQRGVQNILTWSQTSSTFFSVGELWLFNGRLGWLNFLNLVVIRYDSKIWVFWRKVIAKKERKESLFDWIFF